MLNSSIGCFWLKQNSHNKGNEGYQSGIKSENWERFFEFSGTTLQNFPLPPRLDSSYGSMIDARTRRANESSPEAYINEFVPTRAGLDERREVFAARRAIVIGDQEELDWAMYQAYGLIDEDVTVPVGNDHMLELGQRAFEIVLARKVAAGVAETAWFTRHGSKPIITLPDHWSNEYRGIVERRIRLIETHPFIRLLEQPEYKRRWAGETWEVREKRALAGWLLDRLEDRRFWFDSAGRPAAKSIQQLVDEVSRDPDLVSVLGLWDGRSDIPVATSLQQLLDDQVVPFLAAYRYKETGRRKRAAWERTWVLQRDEDDGKHLDSPIPVPPKYVTADFVKQSYWSHRGKLDVPTERFILYPNASRDADPTPVLGWAGWDHAQQSLALATLIGQREQEGWEDEQLVPLIAGLAELLPWVKQWHGEFESFYSDSPANFFTEQFTQYSSKVRMTADELAAWRPVPSTRSRRRSTT